MSTEIDPIYGPDSIYNRYRSSIVEDLSQYTDPNNPDVVHHLVGKDYMLEIQAKPVHYTNLGILEIGEASSTVIPLVLTCRVIKTPSSRAQNQGMPFEDKLATCFSNNSYKELVEPHIITGEPFELTVMWKYTPSFDITFNEVNGYRDFAAAGIPTLTSIKPPHIARPKSYTVITLFEIGLRPLSSINRLFDHEKDSYWTRLWTTMAQIHSNRLFHGDAQLKNFGWSPKGKLLAIDLQGYANFKHIERIEELPGLTAQRFEHMVKTAEQDPELKAIFDQHKQQNFNNPSAMVDIYFWLAVLDDINRIIISVTASQKQTLSSKDATIKAWEVIDNHYLQPLLASHTIPTNIADYIKAQFLARW